VVAKQLTAVDTFVFTRIAMAVRDPQRRQTAWRARWDRL